MFLGVNMLAPYKNKIIKCLKRKLNNNKQLEIVQSINIKEIWYLLGLLESDGALIWFNEKRKSKKYLRVEFTIALEKDDIDLLYWVKKFLWFGNVNLIKHSDFKNNNKLHI